MSILCNETENMGMCLSICGRKQKRKITVLLLGLDNAGKTCTAKCLLKEPPTNIAPTVGFSSVNPRHKKFDVTIYDLGGGQRIRGIWKNYFAEAFGLIFVVDASEPRRLEECRETFKELIKNPKISGKPILVLANKQDNPSALDEVDVCEGLDLESVVNEYKCRTKVETCSAIGRNGKMDNVIKEGYQWLIDTIANDYLELSARVAEAVLLQRETEEKEKAERLERVRRLRADREKSEKPTTAENEEDFVTDPFRPMSDIRDKFDKEEKSKLERASFTTLKGSAPPPPRQPIITNGFVSQEIGDQLPLPSPKPPSPEPVHIKVQKKKSRFSKHNKTAPLDLEIETSNTELPPIQTRPQNIIQTKKQILEPITNPPKTSGSMIGTWGLAEDLEPYFPNS